MSRFVPTKDQYTNTLKRLSSDTKITLILRIMSETGVSAMEIVNLKRTDIDRFHPRGIWVEKAKRIKKGQNAVYVMRSREVPINSSLYTLINTYLKTHTSPYIINSKVRHRNPKPITPRAINYFFEVHGIEWSPHDCRHYFRSQTRAWQIRSRQVDPQVIKEIMGHTLTVHEKYGGESDFGYKLDLVDSVFAG